MGPELPAARGPYRCPPDTHRSASEAYFSGTPPCTSHLELRYPTEMGRQGCAWLAVTAATVGVCGGIWAPCVFTTYDLGAPPPPRGGGNPSGFISKSAGCLAVSVTQTQVVGLSVYV